MTEAPVAISITTIKSDFKKSLADSLGISFDIQTPLLLVVKKNTTVLKRLNTWLLSQTQEINGEKRITNKSLLIIDDEADNASINTKKAVVGSDLHLNQSFLWLPPCNYLHGDKCYQEKKKTYTFYHSSLFYFICHCYINIPFISY